MLVLDLIGKQRIVVLLVSILVIILVFVSCSGISLDGGNQPLVDRSFFSKASANYLPLRVNEIVILPFDDRSAPGVGIPEYNRLTKDLVKAFDTYTNLTVLNIDSSKRVEQELNSQQIRSGNTKERAIELGTSLGAQGVLWGTIVDFGGLPDVKGAIQFVMHLSDPKQNKILWTGRYEHTNVPLSDNLLRIKQVIKEGLGYRSSLELGRQGFEYAAKAIEDLRVEAEAEVESTK